MDLPSGTVTFLFTDIEGSTKLLQELGDGYADALAQHSEIIRGAVATHNGVEVSTEGDAFFCVFEEAADAAAATVGIMRGLAEASWPPNAEFRVRAGMHTGDGVIGGDNYVGLDVHRAARISAAGHGGQALLSAETHELVADSLPEGVTTIDLGDFELKDIPEPEHIYQLVIPGLEERFLPLRTQANPPMPLPPLVAPTPAGVGAAKTGSAAAAASSGILSSLSRTQLALATLVIGLVAGAGIGGLTFGGGSCDEACPGAEVESAPAVVTTAASASTQAEVQGQAAAVASTTSAAPAPTTSTLPPVSVVAGVWTFTVNVTGVTGSVCQGEIGDVYDREVIITGTDDDLELVGLDNLSDPDDPAWTGSFSDGQLKFGGVRAEDDGLTIAAFEMTLSPDGDGMVGTEAWVWDWTSRGETGTCVDGASTVTAVRLGN